MEGELGVVLAFLRKQALPGIEALLVDELQSRGLATYVDEGAAADVQPGPASPSEHETQSEAAVQSGLEPAAGRDAEGLAESSLPPRRSPSAGPDATGLDADVSALSALQRNLAFAKALAAASQQKTSPSSDCQEGEEGRLDPDAELVRRYYEAREVFEFVDDDAVRATTSRSGSSAPVPLPAPAPLEFAAGGFGGMGFTFSPVSAPSPPMSLTGFSWRSADDDEEDGECSPRAAADSGLSAASSPSGSVQHSHGPPPRTEWPRELRRPDDLSGDEEGGEGDDGREAEAGSQAASPSAPLPAARPEQALEVLTLRVVTVVGRTGFEEEKDFPIVLGSTVVEYLGSAAFSKAVQAHDLQTGALVCLKIIKNSKDFFDQSLDEIKLLKHINAADPADEHGLLRLYDYFYHKEHLFIVTELLRANLYEFQKYNRESEEAPYFTYCRLQSIARQVLRSLAFMHSLGLLHCDLKPENILIQSYSRCRVKVIDVGSSCYITDHLSSYVQSRSYRAPEVILGLPYDYRIDIWSLGCILAELATGSVLLQNDSVASLLARVVGMAGPLPPHMRAGRYAHRYFTPDGNLFERDDATGKTTTLRPKRTTLRARLRGADEGFVAFVASLLSVDPEQRPTAAEALLHPWLRSEYEDDAVPPH